MINSTCLTTPFAFKADDIKNRFAEYDLKQRVLYSSYFGSRSGNTQLELEPHELEPDTMGVPDPRATQYKVTDEDSDESTRSLRIYTIRGRSAVVKQLLSLVVQQLRAAANGQVSQFIRVTDGVVLDPAPETLPSVKSVEATTEGEYPVASFYTPAEYDWTTDGYEAREALKRFSK